MSDWADGLSTVGDVAGIATGGIPWGSIISGAGSLLGGMFGADEQGDINRRNIEFAQQQQQFSAQQAQKQMDFQERMSNTAYQRGTSDMISAGLNPMLAYSQGGASTPSGAQGSLPSAPVLGSRVAAGMQSASQVQAMNTGLDKVKAETDLLKAQKAATDAQTQLAYSQSSETQQREKVGREQQGNIGTDTTLKWQTIANLQQEAEKIAAQVGLTKDEAELVRERIKAAPLERDRIVADTGNARVDTVLKQLDVPHARNLAEAEKSSFKKEVAPYLPDIGSLTGSAARIRPGGR